MGKVILPRLNQTGANEWADVQTNDEAIATVVNGELDNSNIAAGANIARSKLEPGAQGIPGATYPALSIATLQSTGSLTYTKLATPDEITGVVVPTGGLMRVGYLAIWSSTVAEAGFAALKFSGSAVGTNRTPSAFEVHTSGTSGQVLSTSVATSSISSASLTTSIGAEVSSLPSLAFPMTDVFLPAGTYSVAVEFKASSGTVSVKERHLWVEVHTF